MTGVCEQCGRTFEVPASTQESYPGWTPPKCGDCFRGGGQRTRGSGRASSGGTRPRATAGREEHLGIVEVLERYHDGPTDGVFTDGSAIPNPGPGGWGAVYVVDGDVVAQDHGHAPDTTNNRMELQAIIEGIRLVPSTRAATLYTDSRLAVDTLTTWAAGWEKRGWRRRTGPVENLDLVKEAYGLVRSRPQITIKWVKAHAGNRWNEYADALATAWARDEL